MNDRIKNLIKQCTDFDYRTGQNYFDKERFAELIVKEHLALLQQEWYDINNAPMVGNESLRDVGIRVGKKGEVLTLMHKIRTHFGVNND